MLNIADNTLSGFDPLGVWIAAGHGNSGFDNVTIVHEGLVFRNFNFISDLDQSLSFHFKFFLTHKNSSFLYSFLKIFEKIIFNCLIMTAQNTTGVTAIMEVTPEFLAEELDNIFTDIYPDAVKIGMVSSGALLHVIAEKLQEYKARNIVVDPVMIATSGARLISEEAVEVLKNSLLPMAALVTPNIPEAEVLSGRKIVTSEDMIKAAALIGETYHCAVLCKGGHQLNDANDLLWKEGGYRWFRGERINNPNTHGTGCTLSSAIASNLAKGYELESAVERAKKYISGALAAMLDLGKGSGPMDHGFDIHSEFTR